MSSLSRASLTTYHDYRDYLADWYGAAKADNQKISFRYIAKLLGFKAPNSFQLVIQKKRHLSAKSLSKLLPILRLSGEERQYFELLFQRGTSKDRDRVEELTGQMERVAGRMTKSPIGEGQFELIVNNLAWFIMMGAIQFEGQSESAVVALVKRSCPFPMEDKAIVEALRLLERHGKLSFEEGVYRFDFDQVKTPLDLDKTQIKRFHEDKLQLALKTIGWPIEERFFSNVSVPANDYVVGQIKKEVRDLCIRILNLSSSQVMRPEDCEQVVSLEFSLFPFFRFDGTDSSLPPGPPADEPAPRDPGF